VLARPFCTFHVQGSSEVDVLNDLQGCAGSITQNYTETGAKAYPAASSQATKVWKRSSFGPEGIENALLSFWIPIHSGSMEFRTQPDLLPGSSYNYCIRNSTQSSMLDKRLG
jgi:hypothetical protein